MSQLCKGGLLWPCLYWDFFLKSFPHVSGSSGESYSRNAGGRKELITAGILIVMSSRPALSSVDQCNGSGPSLGLH